MSVNLYPGIRKLHLIYSTRYDTIRTEDVRDDLLGIRVWISKTSGFDPQLLVSKDFGIGSSVSLDELEINTYYYVRYAFISKIDPDVYTISDELVAKTYDELTTVYGELTNDPVFLQNLETGEIDWSQATGIFRVWDASLEVTGTGPVYSIIPNTATNGLQVTIDAQTGVYNVTGWDTGTTVASVSFSAEYSGVTVIRDLNLVYGVGQEAPQIRISASPANFIYLDENAVLAQTTSTTVTALLFNLSGIPTFLIKAYTREGIEILSPVQFTQQDNTITITNQQFHVNNTIGYIVVEARIGNVFDQLTINRLNNGTSQITVELSNPVAQLQADENGVVDQGEYLESGTQIRVYEGAQLLRTDLQGVLKGSWRIDSITGVGIVPEDQPIVALNYVEFPEHANMTTDTAHIDYTIRYVTRAGLVDTRVVRQNLSKSKQGVTGASAPQVKLNSERLAFVKPANGDVGDIWPEYIDVAVSVSNIDPLVPGGALEYDWRIDGILQPTETNSFIRIPKFSTQVSKTVEVSITGLNSFGETITLTDQWTLYYLQEGSDALVATVSPDVNVITCDSQGIPDATQFPLLLDTFLVRGIEIISPQNILYQLQDLDGVVATMDTVTPGRVRVVDVTKKFAGFTLAFTYAGVTLYKQVRFNKTVDGDSAPQVNLTTTNQIFTTLKNTGQITPANTTITATAQNVADAVYTWYIDNIQQPQYQDDLSIVVPAFSDARKLIKCEVTSTANPALFVFDFISLYNVKEGDDTLVLTLSNENQTLTADSLGIVAAGQYPITCQMVLLRGSELLTSGVTYSIVSQTGTDSSKVLLSSTGSLSISSGGVISDFAEVELAASIGDVTLVKVLTLSKSREGAPGLSGINTATVALYAKNTSSSAPPAAFSGTFTYTFSTSTLSGGTLNGWSTTAPSISNGEYLWVRYATAASSSTTDSIDSAEFSGAVVTSVGGVNGTNGINTATVALYAKNTSSSTAPAAFSGTFTYTFSTSTLSGGTLNGWSTTAPSISNGEYLWVRYATAASSSTTDTIDSAEFSGAVVTSVGGVNGTNGINTATVELYAKNTSSSTAPAAFSGTATYTFSTNSLTGLTLGSWTRSAPSISKGEYLWVRQAVASSSTNTDTISIGEWSTATIVGIGGLDGEIPNIDNLIDKTANTILTGSIQPNDSGSLKVGSITWNSSTGAITGGSGLAITSQGLIAAKNGVATVTVGINGDAIFSGSIITSGDSSFEGRSTSTQLTLINTQVYDVDYSSRALALTNPFSSSSVRAGFLGQAGASAASVAYNVGVMGIGTQTDKGIGVLGQGTIVGGYFSCSQSTGIAVRAINSHASGGIAVECAGRLKWGNYTYTIPDGSVTKYMRADGTWIEVSSLYSSSSVSISGGSTATIENRSGSLPGSKWFFGPDSGGNFLVYNNNSVGMYIASGAQSWSAGSDESLKDEVGLVADNACARIRGLIPRYFTFKQDVRKKVHIGYFAQNVKDYIPEAVIPLPNLPQDSQDLLAITPDTIHVHLVKAVQELIDENEMLKQKIDVALLKLAVLESKDV